jgi:hypothetical protein
MDQPKNHRTVETVRAIGASTMNASRIVIKLSFRRRRLNFIVGTSIQRTSPHERTKTIIHELT